MREEEKRYMLINARMTPWPCRRKNKMLKIKIERKKIMPRHRPSTPLPRQTLLGKKWDLVFSQVKQPITKLYSVTRRSSSLNDALSVTVLDFKARFRTVLLQIGQLFGINGTTPFLSYVFHCIFVLHTQFN